MIANAPCNKPAAPNPRKARPKISTADVGAAAQIADPTTRSKYQQTCTNQHRKGREEPHKVPTFKQNKRNKIHNLGVKKPIQIPKKRLKGRQSKQVGGAVPGHLGEGAEFSRDRRDGDADDVDVDAEEEGADAEAGDYCC